MAYPFLPIVRLQHMHTLHYGAHHCDYDSTLCPFSCLLQVKHIPCNMHSCSLRVDYVTIRRWVTSACWAGSSLWKLTRRGGAHFRGASIWRLISLLCTMPLISLVALVLRIWEVGGEVKFFIVRFTPSTPSAEHGIPGRHWQVNFIFVVLNFIIDAMQDVCKKKKKKICKMCLPWRQGTTARHWYSPFIPHAHILTGLPHSVLVHTQPTGRVLHLEASQYPSTGNSKHKICSDFLGMITQRGDKLDDRLFVWNWKTGILLVDMVCWESAQQPVTSLTRCPNTLLR